MFTRSNLTLLVSLLGTILMVAVGIFVLYRVQTGQEIIPTFADTATVVMEDSDSRITYQQTWDLVQTQGNYQPRGGSMRQCRFIINGDCTATIPKINNLSFNQIKVGFPTRPNGSSMKVMLDNKDIGTITQTGNLQGNANSYVPWVKDVPCGPHEIKFVPDWAAGSGNKAVAIDYVELRTCQGAPLDIQITSFKIADTGKPASTVKATVTVKNEGTQAAPEFKIAIDKKNAGGKFTCEGVGDKSAEVTVTGGLAAGASKTVDIDMPTPAGAGSFNATIFVDSTCKVTELDETNNTKTLPYTTTDDGNGGGDDDDDDNNNSGEFLICKNYACTKSTSVTKDDVACAGLAAGDECGKTGDEACQGNVNAPAKCFDCKRDNPNDSQINILDFSCFANYFGENVGK